MHGGRTGILAAAQWDWTCILRATAAVLGQHCPGRWLVAGNVSRWKSRMGSPPTSRPCRARGQKRSCCDARWRRCVETPLVGIVISADGIKVRQSIWDRMRIVPCKCGSWRTTRRWRSSRGKCYARRGARTRTLRSPWRWRVCAWYSGRWWQRRYVYGSEQWVDWLNQDTRRGSTGLEWNCGRSPPLATYRPAVRRTSCWDASEHAVGVA